LTETANLVQKTGDMVTFKKVCDLLIHSLFHTRIQTDKHSRKKRMPGPAYSRYMRRYLLLGTELI